MMNNIRIGKRLGMGFALILSLSLVIAVIGIWRLQSVAAETNAMMATPLAKERMISDWYLNTYAGIRRATAIAKSADTSLGPFFKPETETATRNSGELQKKIGASVDWTNSIRS